MHEYATLRSLMKLDELAGGRGLDAVTVACVIIRHTDERPHDFLRGLRERGFLEKDAQTKRFHVVSERIPSHPDELPGPVPFQFLTQEEIENAASWIRHGLPFLGRSCFENPVDERDIPFFQHATRAQLGTEVIEPVRVEWRVLCAHAFVEDHLDQPLRTKLSGAVARHVAGNTGTNAKTRLVRQGYLEKIPTPDLGILWRTTESGRLVIKECGVNSEITAEDVDLLLRQTQTARG